MESNKHALVLTGELLPGADSAAVWNAVAEYFRIDLARLNTEVLARVPMTIKESEDLTDLDRRMTALTTMGAQCEVHPSTGGSYFVLIDNVPRGPLPRVYIDQRMRNGLWPTGLKAAAVGSSDWHVLQPMAASLSMDPFTAAPIAPAAEVEADTVAAKIARLADSIAGRKEQPLPLPAGDAIHAGFWRRCAAYSIDALITIIPGAILSMIPVLGFFAYIAGYWLYFALQESSSVQATLGKRAMGLIVTDGTGQRLSFGQATGRFFAAAINWIIIGVGYALAGWTSRKQGLHDLIADTCVVFKTVQAGEPLPTVRPPMPWYGWAANCLLLAVIPLAILAAIAVPTYQEYVIRAKVNSAIVDADAAKFAVAAAIINDGNCQTQIPESANPLVASIRVSGNAPDCVITMMLAADDGTPGMIRGQAIEWQYSESADWTCSSAITPKYLPTSCRP